MSITKSLMRQPILVFAPRSMAHVERCRRRPENTNLNTNTQLHDNKMILAPTLHSVGLEHPIEDLKM